MASLIGVVTNPHSGKNRRRGGDRLQQLQQAVGRHGIVRQTKDLDELREVLGEFIDAGCDHWVSDGGDGTLHWMLSVGWQVARERARRGGDAVPATLPRIVPANGGSIDFVAHKAGIRGQATDVLRQLVESFERGHLLPAVELDTLRMQGRYHAKSGARFRDKSGAEAAAAPGADPSVSAESFERLGFASAIGGVAQRFFEKLYEHPTVDSRAIVTTLANSLGGAMLSTVPRSLDGLMPTSLRDFADEIFEPTRARVELDGQLLAYDDFASLQVGSIDINLGGVVRTFRHAAAPGIMHAQAISMSRWGVAANLPNIVLGTPIWGDKVYDGPTRRLRATALPGGSLDPVIDGELFFGLSELEVQAGPRLSIPAVCQAS
ncbi:MAG: diacylglycerol kinase family protein [Nannocystaceae bacterium]